MAQLGAMAYRGGRDPGQVPDCYLGLRLDPDDAEAPGCWWSPRPRCCIRVCAAGRHPGTLLYELVTGHPDRAAVLGGGEGHGGLGVVGELLAEVLHGRPFGIIA